MNAALGDKEGDVHFSDNAENIGGGHIASEGQTVRMTTLDQWAARSRVEHIDFIKADIEGAERDMLRGARRVLKEFAPKLAICPYHLPDDREVLEHIVMDANPNYRIEHKYKKMYAYVP